MGESYSCELRRGEDGRIAEKTETVAGRPTVWTYAYDKAGRLTGAKRDGRTVCAVEYDREGRRLRDYFPHLDTSYRSFAYTTDNRLRQAGNNGYTHDKNGFRSIWNQAGQYTLYEYGADYRPLKAEKPETGEVFEFTHDDQGRRAVKSRNGQPVEAYRWLDLLRLDGYHDGEAGYRFAYRGGERTPYAMQRENGEAAYLFYDQVGSLRVVADGDGNMIKEVLYDPFGGIIEDSNPALRIPIGFAGGLHDRDLGFVRFGWRDYDTFTSRWTAPDPMGDAGGDPDWYGYCLDDPVNLSDPFGLMGSRPEAPEGTEGPSRSEPYFQDSWQWQASPGACEKCRALDGRMFHGDLSGVPDKPHPNCKCQVVACEYFSKYGEWKEIEKVVVGERIVAYWGKINVAVLWERTLRLKEVRERTYWRQCGSREPEFIGHGKDEARYREQIEERKGGGYITDEKLYATNPWTGQGGFHDTYPGP
ncbi:MAG: RHS repeat-associated core domain-containing protein [Pseudodesulfovibrio sp.]